MSIEQDGPCSAGSEAPRQIGTKLMRFGVVPGATIPAFAITAIWMLGAMVVAVRQALNYESIARAVAVCGLGWALAIAIAAGPGLAFGPTVS